MDVIPRGARFGPLIGQSRALDSLAESALSADAPISSRGGNDRQRLWRIYGNKRLTRVIDVDDDRKANWMKFVQPALSKDAQNLVACQVS